MVRAMSKSIRFKIMIALLVVITAVVSAITFTMANLFHADKKTYVSDTSRLVAQHVASEAHTLIEDNRARLESYASVIFDDRMDRRIKNSVLRQMASDFPDIVVLAAFDGDRAVGTIYNPDAMEEAGLDPAHVDAFIAEDRAEAKGLAHRGYSIKNSTAVSALPTYTMALDHSREGGKTQRVAMAVIRVDGLMRLVKAEGAFSIYLLDPNGTLLAHPDLARVADKEVLTTGNTLSPGAAAEVRPYISDGKQVIGGIAPIEAGGLTAVAEVPQATAFFASRELLGRLTAVSLGLLIVAALIALVWSRTLTGPIRRLAEATKAVGQGRFDVQVDVKSKDEIGTLAGSFNSMASELNAREQQLKHAQGQLIQSEKMAAFGQLGAGFAHEIKNPLAGILGLIQINMRMIGIDPQMRNGLELMEKETKRCKAIIDNLLKFARQEQVTHEPVTLRKVLDDAGSIMRHQLGLHEVQLEVEVADDLQEIDGNANQLQQVIMNLILNAQQAMDGPGTVQLSAYRSAPGRVQIKVQDDGPGIPEELQLRIFEPFFTTKQAGEGTGLGLSVSFGIVKDHGGEIWVESKIGEGTTFYMEFPERAANVAGHVGPPSSRTAEQAPDEQEPMAA